MVASNAKATDRSNHGGTNPFFYIREFIGRGGYAFLFPPVPVGHGGVIERERRRREYDRQQRTSELRRSKLQAIGRVEDVNDNPPSPYFWVIHALSGDSSAQHQIERKQPAHLVFAKVNNRIKQNKAEQREQESRRKDQSRKGRSRL